MNPYLDYSLYILNLKLFVFLETLLIVLGFIYPSSTTLVIIILQLKRFEWMSKSRLG